MAVYFFVVLPPCQRRGVLLGQQQLSQNAVGDEHALGGQVPTGVLLLGKAHFLAFLQDLVQRAERQQEAADIFF